MWFGVFFWQQFDVLKECLNYTPKVGHRTFGVRFKSYALFKIYSGVRAFSNKRRIGRRHRRGNP